MKTMFNRREFFETSGAFAAMPLVGMGDQQPANEYSPGVPVVKFDEHGAISNVEELMKGPVIFEPDEDSMKGRCYSAWLNREDYVVCKSPWAMIGSFWGLVEVEVRRMTSDRRPLQAADLLDADCILFVCLHPTTESVRDEVRKESTVYFRGKPIP